MPTVTPNYNLKLPLVADPTDEDQWGGLLNENFSDLDTIVKAVSDATYTMVQAKSANYSILSTDRNYMLTMDATAGTRTFTLPAANTVPNGFLVIVKKADSSANVVNISGTVEGVSNLTLRSQYDYNIFLSDGTNWFSLAGLVTAFKVDAGFVVQKGYAENLAYSGINTIIPVDDTVPLITEGTQILSLAFTPKIATSILRVRVSIQGTPSANTAYSAVLFMDNTAIAVTSSASVGNGFSLPMNLNKDVVAGTTSPITFTVRFGGGVANVFYLNGINGGRFFGGICSTNISIEEIKA